MGWEGLGFPLFSSLVHIFLKKEGQCRMLERENVSPVIGVFFKTLCFLALAGHADTSVNSTLEV